MVTTTTLLCSKFSPNCVRVMDSFKRLNINPEAHMKVVWIDHPNIRAYLRDTGVKTVPSIVVHDQERDISIIYENQRFTDYINNFIQQRSIPPLRQISSQAPLPPSGQQLPSAAQAPLPHLAAMPSFQQQHNSFLTQQQSMLNTLQKAQADLAVQQVHAITPSPDMVRANLNRQLGDAPAAMSNSGMKAVGQQFVEKASQSQLDLQARRAHELETKRAMAAQQLAQDEQSRQQTIQQNRLKTQQQYEQKENEREQLKVMSMMRQLRQQPEYADLSDQQLQTVAQGNLMTHSMKQLDDAATKLNDLKQIHAGSPEKMAAIEQEIQTVSQAKMQLLKSRQALPQVSVPNAQHQTQQYQQNNQQNFLRQEVETLKKKIQEDPLNEQLKTLLSQKTAALGVENYQPIRLQQEKIDSHVEMAKKTQIKNGATSIDELLGDGEETLFDVASKRRGTDFHQSEAQINTALSSTKRNSLNQRVREMSNTMPLNIEKGMGHEEMPQSSLPVIPSAKEKVTFIPEEDPFESDMIDSPEPEQVVSSALKKKKSSAVDMAREMEKSRGMLEKEFESRR
jgi:hypothetical protein